MRVLSAFLRGLAFWCVVFGLLGLILAYVLAMLKWPVLIHATGIFFAFVLAFWVQRRAYEFVRTLE